MRWTVLGIILGILIGIIIQIPIPYFLTRYTAVSIMGILDALFGAIRADATGDGYDVTILATGLVFNILLAVGITYLGDRLGLDLYLAASVVFTFRIFSNVGITRRTMVEKWLKPKRSIGK